MKHPLILMCLLAGFITGCNAVEAAPQPDAPEEIAFASSNAEVLQAYLDINSRTENIAYKILWANKDSCPQTAPQIGISVHTIMDYPAEMSELASENFGLGSSMQIRHVVPNSPASAAGLRAGDILQAIGPHALISGPSARQFYEGVSVLEMGKGEPVYKIRRADRSSDVTIIPDVLCGYNVELIYADHVNAYTDGEDILLTTELVATTEADISLALIIAHELAHATQGHMFRAPSKALEVEADYLGMRYLINAGYDGEQALAEWVANPFNHKERPELTHPSPKDRIAAMQRAINLSKK